MTYIKKKKSKTEIHTRVSHGISTQCIVECDFILVCTPVHPSVSTRYTRHIVLIATRDTVRTVDAHPRLVVVPWKYTSRRKCWWIFFIIIELSQKSFVHWQNIYKVFYGNIVFVSENHRQEFKKVLLNHTMCNNSYCAWMSFKSFNTIIWGYLPLIIPLN